MGQFFYQIRKAVGGLADGSRSGQQFSYRHGEFIDTTDPDLMAIMPSLVSEQGTFLGKIRWIDTDGTNTFAYDDLGNIYYRNSSNWSLIHTVASSVGNGMYIWNGYLYYTSNTTLGRYGPFTGVPAFNDSFQTGLTSDEYHPLGSFSNMLLVGNNKYLATYDGAVWSVTRLTFATDWRVRDIEVLGQYVVAGCIKGADLSVHPEGRQYLWNGTSTTFDEIVTYSGGINAMKNDNGILYSFVGHQADLYAYNGAKPVRIKAIPNIGLDSVEVEPGAMSMWNNTLLFGLSGGTSDLVSKSVMSYGSLNNDFDDALTINYLPSHGKKTGKDVKITAIRQFSPTLCLVAWEDDGTYGIDRIDGTQYHVESTYESLKLDRGTPYAFKVIMRMHLNLKVNLANQEYVNIYMRKNAETDWVKVGVINETNGLGESSFVVEPILNIDSGEVYQNAGYEHEFKLTWGGEGDTRPAISSFIVVVDEEDPK